MTAAVSCAAVSGLGVVKVHATDMESATSAIWPQTLGNAKPLINNIVLPVTILVVVVILIVLTIWSYWDYKQSREVNW